MHVRLFSSRINSSLVALSQHRLSYGTVSHGRLSYGSIVHSRFSNGISSHDISHRLATPIELRDNTSQQPISKDQQDFSSRESTLVLSSRKRTLDFSSDRSQLVRILRNCYASSLTHWLSLISTIMLNVRLFSTVHHRCGNTITGPTHKRRRLIHRYLSKGNYSNTCGDFIHKCAAIMNA